MLKITVTGNVRRQVYLASHFSKLNYTVNVFPEYRPLLKRFPKENLSNADKYMVYVLGKDAPKIIHNSYEKALAEAERLSKIENLKNNIIHILKVKATFTPSFKHNLCVYE